MKTITPPATLSRQVSPGPLGKMRNGLRNYYEHLRLFSTNVRLYLFGSFLMGINFHVFQLLLNLYLREMGFDESQIGLVVSARAVGMTLIAIPAALILSRIKLKPILISTCVLFGLFSFLMTSSQQLFLLIGFSLLSGTAFTFYRVAAAPFYMRNSTQKERTHIFSLSAGMMILSGMAGSVVAGKLVTTIGDYTGSIITGYHYTLYLGIVVSLLALIPFLRIQAKNPSREESRINLSKAQLKERGGFYFRITISNFLVGLGAGLIIPFLNLYFRDRFNLPPDTIGYYYFVVQLAMLAGLLAGPILAQRLGLVRTVTITQLASIPFMLLLSYTYDLTFAFWAFIIRGGLMNMGGPIVTNFGMELSDKNEQGLVNALLTVAWTSSWMVSAAIGGTLIEKYGYTVTMNITIGLYIVSTLVFYVFFRGTEIRESSSNAWIIAKEQTS